jgi:hypothetical protein
MKIEAAIDIYEVDGVECLGLKRSSIGVSAHWNREWQVVLKIGEHTYTVEANDLKQAIERCSGVEIGKRAMSGQTDFVRVCDGCMGTGEHWPNCPHFGEPPAPQPKISFECANCVNLRRDLYDQTLTATARGAQVTELVSELDQYRRAISSANKLIEQLRRDIEVETIVRHETYRDLEAERTARGEVERQLAEAKSDAAKSDNYMAIQQAANVQLLASIDGCNEQMEATATACHAVQDRLAALERVEKLALIAERMEQRAKSKVEIERAEKIEVLEWVHEELFDDEEHLAPKIEAELAKLRGATL